MAIRSALGASRPRIVRQLLLEAGLIAVVGGLIGVGLSWIGVAVFNAALVNIERPYWIDIRIDAPVLGFALGSTLLASLVAGTVPALKATGRDRFEVLKDEGKASAGMRIGRLSTVLVTAEIATSCALLIGAGMLTKSVINLRTLDMGFEPSGVFTARIDLPELDYADAPHRREFFRGLVDRVDAMPGVRSVAVASGLPALGTGRYYFGVEGTPYPTDRDYPFANQAVISPRFFATLGAAVIEGRDFSVQDQPDGLPVAIVNASFASKYLSPGSALGRRIRMGRSTSSRPWRTIVGVVPDLHVGGGVGGIGSSRVMPEQFYLPHSQSSDGYMELVARVSGDPLAITNGVRTAVGLLDPNLPVADIDTMDGAIQRDTWAFGLFGSLFGIFGVIALFMSAVGLYGVMAFAVGRRTQEIGVRMAVGATTGNVMRLIFGRGFAQLGVGLGIGVALGALMSRPMQVVFFDVNPTDPVVYGAIVITLVATGALACVVPALRATRIELVKALRPD